MIYVWQGKVRLGSNKMFTSLMCLLSRLLLLFLGKIFLEFQEIPRSDSSDLKEQSVFLAITFTTNSDSPAVLSD